LRTADGKLIEPVPIKDFYFERDVPPDMEPKVLSPNLGSPDFRQRIKSAMNELQAVTHTRKSTRICAKTGNLVNYSLNTKKGVYSPLSLEIGG